MRGPGIGLLLLDVSVVKYTYFNWHSRRVVYDVLFRIYFGRVKVEVRKYLGINKS